MIPGINVLSLALSVVAPQDVQYEAFLGASETDSGLMIDTYAPAVTVQCSVQPVPRSKYESMGLDLQKSFVNIWTSTAMKDLDRERVGDKLTYAGTVYRVVSSTPWLAQDGWQELLCERIGDG